MTGDTFAESLPAPGQQIAQPRRKDIQGLRALAIVLVVATHAGITIPGGFTGVDIFFAISGFVITSLIIREIEGSGSFQLRHFYMRRAVRLIPALALMILVTALVGAVLLSPFGTQQVAGGVGAAASFWMSNFALVATQANYFSPHTEGNPFLHTWSLGVEEQFYLLFPFVIMAALMLGRRFFSDWSRAIFVAMAILTSASLALSVGASLESTNSVLSISADFAFYGSPTRAWEFGAGALLAYALLRSPAWFKDDRRLLTWLGAGLIVLSIVWISSVQAFPGIVAVLPVLGTVLIIAGGTSYRKAPITRLLSVRPIVIVGDISYSWYLWHWPFIVYAKRISPGNDPAVWIGVALSLGVAYLSYRFVETKFRRMPRHGFRNRSLVLGVAVALPALVCGALFIGAQHYWGDKNLKTASEQLLQRPVGYGDCLSDIPISKRDLTRCTWGSESKGRPIYLLGDSNAQQFSEAVIAAGQAVGRPVTIVTMGGCAFVAVEVREATDPSQESSCRNWVSDARSWINAQTAGTVVLGAAGEGIGDPGVSYRLQGEQWAEQATSKREAWTQGMIIAVKDLMAAQHEVLLVHVIPHFPSLARPWWHPVECSNEVAYTHPEDCGVELSLKDVEYNQQDEYDSEQEAVKMTGARDLDLRNELCPEGECRTVIGGHWIYRDGLHISPAESTRLGPLFTAFISK